MNTHPKERQDSHDKVASEQMRKWREGNLCRSRKNILDGQSKCTGLKHKLEGQVQAITR